MKKKKLWKQRFFRLNKNVITYSECNHSAVLFYSLKGKHINFFWNIYLSKSEKKVIHFHVCNRINIDGILSLHVWLRNWLRCSLHINIAVFRMSSWLSLMLFIERSFVWVVFKRNFSQIFFEKNEKHCIFSCS